MLPDIHKLLKPRPRKYRNLVRHLSQHLLTIDNSGNGFTNEDIFRDLTSNRGTDRFLGFYSKRGIEFGLRQFGIFNQLKKTGLPNGRVLIDTSDPYKHRLQIKHLINGIDYLSCEVILRRGTFPLPKQFTLKPKLYDFIIIEWLLLQHPLKPFTRRRPQLPGQEYPGLGISEIIFEMFYWLARRFSSDGALIIPNYLHTGLFYGRQFLFLEPVRQGQLYHFGKLVLKKYRLDQLTWACAEGQLIDRKNNRVYLWEPAPMALPVSRQLKDYFHHADYVNTVRTERKQFRAEINPGYRKIYTSDWKAKQG